MLNHEGLKDEQHTQTTPQKMKTLNLMKKTRGSMEIEKKDRMDNLSPNIFNYIKDKRSK